VKQSSEAVLTEYGLGSIELLARFFPDATAVRIPAQVTVFRGPSAKLHEATVIEFASAQHAIFVSGLPLELDDRLRLQRDWNGTTVDAAVIAVHYHEGRKIVAVRLPEASSDWVTLR
jgi:hypothetical protein